MTLSKYKAFEHFLTAGDERIELGNNPLRSPYLQGFHRFYNDYSDYLSNQSLVYNIQLLITGNLS